MDQDELRKALEAEISSEAPDFDRISSLAAQISQADPNSARFTVDAGMVARLGRELVQRHDTALSELVKNGYDADATRIDVHIAREQYGNFIEISDDGSGMSKEELTLGFMRLATTSKVENPRSPRFGRRRAGKKGVGRFAAERLGRRLILTTATAESAEALRMNIDWDRFAAGMDLSTIKVPIERIQKPWESGTTLRIERLRDNWPTAVVERTFRHIAHLIDPGDQTRGAGTGSDFYVRFRVDGRWMSVVDVRTEVAKYAFAVIEGRIDANGKVTYGLRCPRLEINFADRPLRMGDDESDYVAHARNAKLLAYYFILDRSNIPTVAYNTVTTFQADNGGIRLYRNGFRVPPYGEAGDDWLQLDQLSSRRTQTLAPIRNRNFLGSVSITDEGARFEETSSREGLIHSDALADLVTVFQSLLLTATREIDAERTRRNLKRDRPPPIFAVPPVQARAERSGQAIAQDLVKMVAEARRAFVTSANASSVAADGAPGEAAFDRLEKIAVDAGRKAARHDALLREIDLLRVLASMGLAVGQFTHEFSTLSGAMRADLTILLEPERTEDERIEAAESLRTLLDQAREFSGLFKSMTEENALRERQEIDLYEAISSFKVALRSILIRNSVELEIDDGGREVLTPPMHRSELFGILLNFTTNAIKAIKRARTQGRILVRLSTEAGFTVIEFLDNGDGVAPEVRSTLFDAFVTTTAAKGRDIAEEELALGSGLGLTIVRDIVEANGGSVTLEDGEGPYVTNFRVALPLGASIT